MIVNVVVSERTCARCTPPGGEPVRRLDVQFKPGTVPPGISLQYDGCVGGCDDMMNEFFATIRGDGNGGNRENRQQVSG